MCCMFFFYFQKGEGNWHRTADVVNVSTCFVASENSGRFYIVANEKDEKAWQIFASSSRVKD